MKLKIRIKFLILIVLGMTSIMVCSQAMADTVASSGALNTPDMDLINQQQFEMREKPRFEEIQQKNKEEAKKKVKKKHKKDKNAPPEENAQEPQPVEEKPAAIKAGVENYQTQGVYIGSVDVTPSKIISEEKMDEFLAPIKGQNVFFTDIQAVVNNINKYYAENGFVTAKAFLPEQTITDGVLKIDLVEGTIGKFEIADNKWTKDSYIDKRLGAKEGQLFDIIQLEKNMVNFNKYNDGIKLSASLEPGEENGTTNVKVSADEKFPFHIAGMFDNAGRMTIGKQRLGAMVSADSLFGYRDRLTGGSYFSRSSITPFADYNIPVNKYDGRVGASFSMSESQITHGDYTMFNIESQSYNYSLYYDQPLIRKPFFELNAEVSGQYKQATTSFDSYDLFTDHITAAEIGFNARYDTKRGIWYANQGFYYAFPIISSQSNYFKYEGGLIRLHDFSHGIVGQLRFQYQFIPQDVIPYIDQFQAGGLASVRGYNEGVLVGRSGGLFSGELHFPIAPSTIKRRDKNNRDQVKRVAFIGKYVKGLVFFDLAGVFPYKGTGPGAQGITSDDWLASIGFGTRIQLPGDFSARLYWGIPVIQNPHDDMKKCRFHFELTMAPDIDMMLKYRKTKVKEHADVVQRQQDVMALDEAVEAEKAKKLEGTANTADSTETPASETPESQIVPVSTVKETYLPGDPKLQNAVREGVLGEN